MSIYAAMAAGLAAAGVYAVLAFVIASRVREIAIRLALGASPSRVSRMLLPQTLRPVAIGALAGLAAAIAAARMANAAGVPFFAPWWSGVLAAAVMLLMAVPCALLLSRRAAAAAPGAELAH
jgi:ABC-type antimicrobial peptide transport system permease subunit